MDESERKEVRRKQQRIRRTNQLIANAKALSSQRKCNGKAKIKDENGNLIIGENGKPLRGPCPNAPIKGGSVCMAHGGRIKRIKAKAARVMASLVEPALVALGEMIEQTEHMPSRLGAIRTVLERAGDNAIGALKKAEAVDSRPVINIGIAVSGVPIPTPQVKVGLIPTVSEPQATDLEIVPDRDDSE